MGLQCKYLRLCCCIRDSLKFNIHHDQILKMLNFQLLTPRARGVLGAKICYRIATYYDLFSFDMQHDHDVKSLSLTF